MRKGDGGERDRSNRPGSRESGSFEEPRKPNGHLQPDDPSSGRAGEGGSSRGDEDRPPQPDSPPTESEAERGQGIEEAGSKGERVVTEEPGAETTSKDEAAELLDQLRRLQAEFANFRKRIQKERAEWETRAKGDLLAGMLPVLDDLDRARAAVEAERSPDPHSEGFLLILARLADYLRAVGLREQPSGPGTVFDPHEHEALLTSPSDEQPEGRILETLQRGYLYKDQILRRARVRVSRGPDVG
ncbi:MAG: nucleotide exchange factor GrpE [Candidatus Eisenbacteria bacterium]|nr:nucleotide exchange factor GrpE [Candidatus Eisenbacteria bacterium]